MPQRQSLTSSFSITDANNEVVCPLRNQDGSSCRKRCIGEKRYRSMQEHIRRAHPEHYIPKLPATEESFLLMINTPPQDRSQLQQQQNNANGGAMNGGMNGGMPHGNHAVQPIVPPRGYQQMNHTHAYFRDDSAAPDTPRGLADFAGGAMLPTESAAAALAQLGQAQRMDSGWDSGEEWQSDTDGPRIPRSTIELPPINNIDPTSEPFPSMNSVRQQQRDLLPSILSNSPPAGRSSTLPPLQRPLGPNRRRKQSVTKPGHKKQKSRGQQAADWLRRIQNDDHYGKRWEDLIDAAASATEDIEDDRTPVPQSPISMHRASMPPFPHNNVQTYHGYQASPLQQALTPPSFHQEMPEPFPSVESGESGDQFHIGATGLSDSSPSYSSQDVHIYCAACQKSSKLKESYACTECICGLCRECVNVLMEEQGARRKCPRCATIGGRFKPFQLDIR
ncbi:hypothetical protein BKA67DRAFT_366202 [Truncatella angustata]|uniref:RING-type domain-containing protein n=1 Tax=Truncatella angustata TaxID=152316 RepID=A0A9P8ZSR0_9PEZI|nr:uncharacterized protein BKA67DRAFT_366202 [Truncatella angustata]KAH6648515.1 hypothetical protein BKA67DRAFT_366202 [Truncatella angustata]